MAGYKGANKQHYGLVMGIAGVLVAACFAVYYLLSSPAKDSQPTVVEPIKQYQNTYLESAHRARDMLKNLKTTQVKPPNTQTV
jgi:hypothetical protein